MTLSRSPASTRNTSALRPYCSAASTTPSSSAARVATVSPCFVNLDRGQRERHQKSVMGYLSHLGASPSKNQQGTIKKKAHPDIFRKRCCCFAIQLPDSNRRAETEAAKTQQGFTPINWERGKTKQKTARRQVSDALTVESPRRRRCRGSTSAYAACHRTVVASQSRFLAMPVRDEEASTPVRRCRALCTETKPAPLSAVLHHQDMVFTGSKRTGKLESCASPVLRPAGLTRPHPPWLRRKFARRGMQILTSLFMFNTR